MGQDKKNSMNKSHSHRQHIQAQQDRAGTVAVSIARSYSGPIPPPELLREYEEILSGTADRFVTMAEKEQSHRHAMDTGTLNTASWRIKAGLICGVVVSVLALGCGTWLLGTGKTLEGSALTIGTIVTLVGVFVYGESKRKNDAKEGAGK